MFSESENQFPPASLGFYLSYAKPARSPKQDNSTSQGIKGMVWLTWQPVFINTDKGRIHIFVLVHKMSLGNNLKILIFYIHCILLLKQLLA